MNHPQTQAVWWWPLLYWIMWLFMIQETRFSSPRKETHPQTALQTHQDVTYQINWDFSVVLDPVIPFTEDSIIHLWHFSTGQTQEASEQHAEINSQLSFCSPDHNPSPLTPTFVKRSPCKLKATETIVYKSERPNLSFFLSTQWYLLLRFSVSDLSQGTSPEGLDSLSSTNNSLQNSLQ